MDTQSALVVSGEYQPIINLVLDGLTSNHSRDAYGRALRDFLIWYAGEGKPGLNKSTVQRYKVYLQDQGLAPATINLRMSAIRKLAQEAADNGLVDQGLANGISKVKGVKTAGVRAGNWLTRAQAQAFINAPDISTLKGLRDRAILAVMVGAGLRRSEVSNLTFEHIQQREGRWVIVDIVGKGNRVRTVPVPSWAKVAIDAWAEAAGLAGGRVFRGVYRFGRSLDLQSEGITPQVVYSVVAEYAERLRLSVTAHDLRRTFAKLAHKGGAGVDQIQLTLGHASLKTTERYLGVEQDLTNAPCDRLGLDLSGD